MSFFETCQTTMTRKKRMTAKKTVRTATMARMATTMATHRSGKSILLGGKILFLNVYRFPIQ